MPRPNQSDARRREFLPRIARAFAELGYRRATTAELARRCSVRENVLYRLWGDKEAMFIASIGHVYDLSVATWQRLLEDDASDQTPAERLLAYEAEHHGESGHYRIVFAGLTETDNPAIRAAMADMYRRFQHFVADQISKHRDAGGDGRQPSVMLAAWAVVGLGTVASIGRELGLVGERQRRRLIADAGRVLLEGAEC